MAHNLQQIVLRTLTGLLASFALSLGMSLTEKGNTGIFTPPPPGSRDSPIPPDEFIKGSGPSPSHFTNNLPAYDNYPLAQGGSPQSRGGPSMAYYDYHMPPMNDPPDNYPPLPERSPYHLILPGSNMSDVLPPYSADMTNGTGCDWCCWFGCPLAPRNKGQKGDRGDRGLPGLPGSPGSRGLYGLQGPPGFRGPPGTKGQKGDDGLKGDQGPIGFMGLKGDRGFKGDKGDMGLSGSPGGQGPPGSPGQCPASCESIPGSPGEVGLPGIVGPRGLPGTQGNPGIKGQKGDTGVIGVPGVPGVNGQKGDRGDQGVCSCKDGAKGADGNQGLPGTKGEKGEMGHQGSTGVGGTKGEKGDLGVRGPPGPCSPTIQSAFLARLADAYPKPDLPVPFTAVDYNLLLNFNPFSGIYRAPVNGTYVFSYNLVSYSKPLRVGLFHNYNPVVKSTEIVSLATISQQVVLHLNMGDAVWLQVKDTNSNGMFSTTEASSTFSGFLLYPDTCDIPFFRDLPEPITGPFSWGHLDAPSPPVQ